MAPINILLETEGTPIIDALFLRIRINGLLIYPIETLIGNRYSQFF